MASLAEDPDELLMDSIQMIPLKNPVVLSTGFVVDRSTALDEQGRRRLSRCPFTREPLKPEVYPLHMLRKMVVDWRLKQLDVTPSLSGASRMPPRFGCFHHDFIMIAG